MTKINLTAKGRAQELILAYLQENASETLTEKINNGVPVVKDGKTLINKKDLNGFMAFANGEARKLAEKGANSACVEDSVVYGWAIHYFEEDSIEGKLYHEDGTEYQPPKPARKTVTPHRSLYTAQTEVRTAAFSVRYARREKARRRSRARGRGRRRRGIKRRLYALRDRRGSRRGTHRGRNRRGHGAGKTNPCSARYKTADDDLSAISGYSKTVFGLRNRFTTRRLL